MLVNLKRLRSRHKNRLAKGIYQMRGWHEYNFDNYLRDHGIELSLEKLYPEIEDVNGELRYNYGVCDNYQQILDLHPILESSPDKYIIGMTKVIKSQQPMHWGWRWHKWGDYIGTHSPTTEFIYDEKDIDHVYCYFIVKLDF